MVDEMHSSPALERVVILFYNPNIHPQRECIDFIDCDYDTGTWYSRTRWMEYDPGECGYADGVRCSLRVRPRHSRHHVDQCHKPLEGCRPG